MLQLLHDAELLLSCVPPLSWCLALCVTPQLLAQRQTQ